MEVQVEEGVEIVGVELPQVVELPQLIHCLQSLDIPQEKMGEVDFGVLIVTRQMQLEVAVLPQQVLLDLAQQEEVAEMEFIRSHGQQIHMT
jgi:hypothetical protein